MFRLLCKYCGFILLVVVIIIAIRTITFSVRTDPVRSCRLTDEDYIRATDEVISRFKKSLQFRTISTKPHQYDTGELQKMVDFVHTGSMVFVCVTNYGALLQLKLFIYEWMIEKGKTREEWIYKY
jgi:hypothetical protein